MLSQWELADRDTFFEILRVMAARGCMVGDTYVLPLYLYNSLYICIVYIASIFYGLGPVSWEMIAYNDSNKVGRISASGLVFFRESPKHFAYEHLI